MGCNSNEISFCELRTKEIINTVDGRRLGRIIDIIFSAESCKILGIVAPCSRRGVFFRSNQEIFIPWKCIKRIGEDVIIVELRSNLPSEREDNRYREKCDYHEERDCFPATKECSAKVENIPCCDKKCEKCMLFDCPYRWKNGNDSTYGSDVYTENGK